MSEDEVKTGKPRKNRKPADYRVAAVSQDTSLNEVVDLVVGLDSQSACEKWIKTNPQENNTRLMIYRVYQDVIVKLETKSVVTLEMRSIDA